MDDRSFDYLVDTSSESVWSMDAYLRCLLVQGARSVLHTAMRHTDRLARWELSVQARRGYFKALVAIAAKNARIAWALLSKDPLRVA